VLEPRDRRRADSPGSPAAAPAARLHARRRTHHRHRASAGPVQPDRRQRATSVAGRAKVRL